MLEEAVLKLSTGDNHKDQQFREGAHQILTTKLNTIVQAKEPKLLKVFSTTTSIQLPSLEQNLGFDSKLSESEGLFENTIVRRRLSKNREEILWSYIDKPLTKTSDDDNNHSVNNNQNFVVCCFCEVKITR